MMSICHTLFYCTHSCSGPSARGWRVGSIVLAIACFNPVASAETLEQAWNSAIAANSRLDVARHLSNSAEETLSAAKGERLPGLSLQSSYIVLDAEPAAKLNLPSLPVNQFSLAQDETLSYQAAVDMPLYTGGRLNRSIEAARAGIETRASEEARVVANLKLEVAAAYVGVLRAHRDVEVAQRNVTGLASHAVDVQRRFDKGFVGRNQLLAAQVALANARQSESRALNGVDLAQATYNRLLGRELTAEVTLDEIEVSASADDIENLTVRALSRRPELQALAAQGSALRHRSAAERAAAAPQVQLSMGQRYEENRYQVHERSHFAMIGLSWDLFDGGVARHRAASMVQQAAAVDAEREELRSIIRLQVRQAWLDERETGQRIVVTRAALSQADEGLRVVRSRYREGLGTNTEVLDAETQRTLSYSNYYSAVYDAAFASLRLRHALGEL